MNNLDPVSSVPPQIPTPVPSSHTPLGEIPDDREPIAGPMAAVDAILRRPRRLMWRLRQAGTGPLIGALATVAALCSLGYGVVVGTFSGGEQLWAAPVKIGVGLFLSAIICLPSLYIFACLCGSRARPTEILGMVMGLLALTAILLIGFAPVAWLFSQSTSSLGWMGALHLIFWGIATVFGLRFLQVGFSHSEARSNAGFNTWAVIFVLVVLQMTTALRPIVGKAETFLPTEKKLFLGHWGETIAPERN